MGESSGKGDMTREWWVDPKAGCARVNVSDWKPGSPWQHQRTGGSGIVDMVDRVVENSPRRSLVFTWARSNEAEHDLALNPQMHEGISGGWPKVLSNLKTFLETGRAPPRG